MFPCQLLFFIFQLKQLDEFSSCFRVTCCNKSNIHHESYLSVLKLREDRILQEKIKKILSFHSHIELCHTDKVTKSFFLIFESFYVVARRKFAPYWADKMVANIFCEHFSNFVTSLSIILYKMKILFLQEIEDAARSSI